MTAGRIYNRTPRPLRILGQVVAAGGYIPVAQVPDPADLPTGAVAHLDDPAPAVDPDDATTTEELEEPAS